MILLFFLMYAMLLRVKHKFDFRVCVCMCVCVLQPEHYKWPPVERSDSLSMSVTDGHLIYNAQLVNNDYYTQMNSTNFENWMKEKSKPYLQSRGNFRKYAIPLYIHRYSTMQLCSENSCDFD